MKKRIIMTNNREIYEKLSMLNFSNEILLKDVKPLQVERILNNINKNNEVLFAERIGDYFLIKKKGNLNYSIYLR